MNKYRLKGNLHISKNAPKVPENKQSTSLFSLKEHFVFYKPHNNILSLLQGAGTAVAPTTEAAVTCVSPAT